MSAGMQHPTTRVETDNTNIKRNRLKSDLEALDAVVSARDDLSSPKAVVFELESSGIVTSLPSSVMSVLSDHDAELPNNQPKDSGTYSAVIR